MQLIIADCSAIYSGRGDTSLPRGVRSIMVKSDGSVSIHNDVGNKPLNYMKTASFSETFNNIGEKVWTYDSRKESLSITIHSLLMMTEMPLIAEDPGLERDGTENHLQEWLSLHPETLGAGFSLISREFPTGKGPVDLLMKDAEGNPVAVEVKRVAMLGAVDQCRRYLDGLKDPESQPNIEKFIDEHSLRDSGIIDEKFSLLSVRGMVAAVDVRPKTFDWALKHNIETVIVPHDWNDHSKNETNSSPE